MVAMVLACGDTDADHVRPAVTESSDFDIQRVRARPDRTEIDPVIDQLGDRRLLVHGSDADLAAVVLRLLRRDKLADVIVGYVPTSARSNAARIWGLPTDPARALSVALSAEPDRVPLIRDDQGGVLVGLGTIGPLRGVTYCDDQRLLRGPARRVEVVPRPGGPGLSVSVTQRGWLGSRTRTATGRAVEIGCLPTTVVRDGVPHDRPVRRWAWYRHVEDLRLARGLVR